MTKSGLMRGLIVYLAASSASAQQAPPAFAVATVKVNNSMSTAMAGRIGGFYPGGRVGMRNVTLMSLIEVAYGVENYRVSGGPSWIGSARYDVAAKPAEPIDERKDRSTLLLMLQALLAERFGLRMHHETKTVPGYRLAVEKGGAKLQISTKDRDGFEVMSMEEIRGPGTMDAFARVLKGTLGAPVADDTGLTGKYEIKLKWQADEGAAAAAPSDAGGLVVKEAGLSIFTAMREQLGLALRTGKVSVDMIVIDRAEQKPTDN